MINNDQNFDLVLREYIKQENDLLSKRLKYIYERSFNEESKKRDINNISIERIIKSNENKNKEEITLIFYDKNLCKDEDKTKIIELFQQINDYILICCDRETLFKSIEKIPTEKLFLILSGSSIEDILDSIHDYRQIDSIFIFCINKEKYLNNLNNDKYYKIISICTEYETLINSIKENIRYFIKQSEAEHLFNQEEKSMRNLNKHLYEFRSFILFKQVLLKTEYNTHLSKQQMIDISQNYYRNNKKELSNILLFQQTYKSENAVYWYTKQTFVYRLVNKALRTEDYQAILIMRFFIVDLSQNLKELYQQFKINNNQKSNIILSYRGFKLSPPEIHNLKHNIGKIIATNGFLSSSRSKEIAYRFAMKVTKRSNVETVMLEIQVDISKSTTILADVKQFSDFPEEEEILFDLGASFIINSIDYDQKQNLWIVKLTSVSEESFIQDINKFITENCSTTNMNILLGELFFIMEQYSTCRNYFLNILNTFKQDDSVNLAKIYDYIGRTYETEENYDDALLYYTKAYQHYYSLNQLKHMATIKNQIGIIYYTKNDHINARIYYNKSYQLWKQIYPNTSDDQICEIARLMNCFGCLEENNEKAREYFLKALNIYENPSHICHIDNHDYYISQLSEHLAERYYLDYIYDKAVEFMLKNVKILEKYISTIHGRKNYIKSLMKLWKISEKSNQDIWLSYQDQFLQLADIHVINLIPELKDFINDAIILKKNYLQQKQDDNDASNDLLEHSLNSLKLILKTNPLNYEQIIQSNIDIGLAYAKTKDYHWANQHYQNALQLCQTHTPSNFKLLSTIFKCLSDMSLDQNDYDDALNLRMKSININEKTSNLTEKEKEVQSYFDIGEELITKDFDKALEFLIKSLEIRENNSKDDDDDIRIGICHQDIGATYINKLMFDVALKHYIKAVRIYEKYLSDGKESKFNIKTLYSKCHCDIGKIYQNKNDFNKSNEYFGKSIKIVEDSDFSDNLCHLFDCYKGIGLNCYKISDYDSSIMIFGKCLDFILKHIKSSVLCDHRKDISSCLFNLSSVYIDKKEFQLALQYLEKIKEILPENHQNLGNTFLLIGLCYMELKQYDQAIINYENAILNFETHSPIIQQNYALCFNNLGFCYSNMNKLFYDKGIQSLLKSIEVYQEHCPQMKSSIAQCYLTYTLILLKKGEYDDAIQYAFKTLEYLIDQDTINIAISYHLFGLAFYKKEEYEKSLEYLILSKDIYEKHLSDLNNEIGATVLHDMATCHLKLNNSIQALQFAEKSFEIRQQILPSTDQQIADSHSLLALIYSHKQIQQFDKCNQHCVKAIDLSKQIISNNQHIENIGDVFENIALLYFNDNNYRQTHKYYKKALKYFKVDKTDNHSDIQRLQNIIDTLTNQ